DKERKAADAYKPRRKLSPQRRPKPHARMQRDPRAQLLHSRHQRKGEERGPQEPVAESASDLGVGTDPARVVVAGAGDQAWAEKLQPAEWSAAPLARRGGAGGGEVAPVFLLSQCARIRLHVPARHHPQQWVFGHLPGMADV